MFKKILATLLMFTMTSAYSAECILTLSLDDQPLLQNRVKVDSKQKVFKVIDEDKNEIIVFTKNGKGTYDMTFGYPFSNVLVSGQAVIKKINNLQLTVTGTVTDDLKNTASINGIIAGCEKGK